MTADDDKKAAKRAEGEAEVHKAIAAMPDADRTIGERLHVIITAAAPDLMPRTWYGMPAYSNGNKIILFFRSRQKFGERYMTLGFNDGAMLDDGAMWPVTFALKELTADVEAEIEALVRKAVGY